MAKPSDRRRQPRYEAAPLGVQLKIDGRLHPEAKLENISAGGAMLLVDARCPVGKNVLLEVRDKRYHVKVVARVVERIPRDRQRRLPGMRLKFQVAKEADDVTLRRIIRRLRDGTDVPADGLELDIDEGMVDYELDIQKDADDDEDYELKVPDE